MTGAAIVGVDAWEAFDSRGTPTVACRVRLASGAHGNAIVPSGASRGGHEVHELRDGGARYAGLGVRRAVAHVRDVLGPAVRSLDAHDQPSLDRILVEVDGTADLSRLGGNAVLAVSCAAALAAAADRGEPLYRVAADGASPLLPMPMVNVISGGAHAGHAVDVQDFLVVPVGAASFSQAIEWCWRVRRETAQAATQRGLETALVADEGGLGLTLPANRVALELLCTGIERAGLAAGSDAAVAVDVAANQLLTAGGYALASEGRTLTADQLVAELAGWCDEYPVVSIEDPLADDDWSGWRLATDRLGTRVQLLGDDLFATNRERLDRGIADGVANAVLVKPNQTGTLTRARAVVDRARAAGYGTVLSARSGDTEDCWLADLAVGWRTGQIKVGSLTRSERTAKWNRLLEIEAELPAVAFAGRAALTPPETHRETHRGPDHCGQPPR